MAADDPRPMGFADGDWFACEHPEKPVEPGSGGWCHDPVVGCVGCAVAAQVMARRYPDGVMAAGQAKGITYVEFAAMHAPTLERSVDA